MSQATADATPTPRPEPGNRDPLPADEALRDELTKWRERVPKLAQALRLRGEEIQALRIELERLRAGQPDQQSLQQALAERDAAWQRNAELLESTELAGRQIAALTDDLAALRAEVPQGQHEADRESQAAERVQVLEARVCHLEAQLQERSRLVVALEGDQREQADRYQRLQNERDELAETLRRTDRNLRENTEHVTQLDDKLERQKELLAELECELAEAHQSTPSRPDEHSETGALRGQLLRLEALLRERATALEHTQLQNVRLLSRLRELESDLAAHREA
jgi:chromosome segregation ATPase